MDTQENMGSGQNQSSPNPSAPSKNTLMAALSYVGPLVIVSYLTAKDDPFVKFHIKQGLVVFIGDIAVWFLSSMLWGFWMIMQFVNLGLIVLSIIGIINAVQGKEKDLPLVGQYAKNFNF